MQVERSTLLDSSDDAPEPEKEKAVDELLRLDEKARYYGNCSKEEAELAVHAAETIVGKKKSI